MVETSDEDEDAEPLPDEIVLPRSMMQEIESADAGVSCACGLGLAGGVAMLCRSAVASCLLRFTARARSTLCRSSCRIRFISFRCVKVSASL